MEASYLILLMFIFWLIWDGKNKKKQAKAMLKRKIKQRISSNGKEKNMKEFAKQFIGKDCIIYTFDSQVAGIVLDVSESGGALLVKNGNTVEAVNLDYVTRLREYPKNNKGKRKDIVLD